MIWADFFTFKPEMVTEHSEEFYKIKLTNMKNKLSKEIEAYIHDVISKILIPYSSTTRLRFNDFSETHDDYVVVEFYGGLNWKGKWTDYIDAISVLITKFSSDYKCWLVNLDNDCSDDVFYLRLGIRNKK